jgi:hypothetical protein
MSIRLAAASAVTLTAVLGLIGCGGDGGGDRPDFPRVSPPENQAEIRNFTVSELDSLRAMKKRNGVSRDEYWDDRGGVLANDVVEVWYPPGKLTVSHGMYVLDYAVKCRREIADLFGETPEGALQIICTQTMDAYTEFTGRDWWNYAKIEENRITYQPITVLAARGLLDIALPREYYEWSIGRIAGDDAPRWLVEGTASRLAGEETILQDNLTEFRGEPVKMSLEDIEAALEADSDRKQARLAYYNAYMMVKRLDHEFGLDAVAQMLVSLGDGQGLDDASRSAFKLPYEELVSTARAWTGPDEKEVQ